MRCDVCLLQSPEAAGLTAAELVARLGRCDACPLLQGAEPCPSSVVTTLLGKLRESTAEARRQANKLRRAEHALSELQQEITRSDERVTKLEALHAQSTREADAELRRKIEQVERQHAAILLLSTPVIQIWDGVLVLPLIGVLDEQRVANLTSYLLSEIKERRARHTILELTGIRELDATSARLLLRVIDAASLLGARAILCGLRAEVAQTLSGLDVGLTQVRVTRSLNEALVVCLQQQQAASR